jgi:hypothetical protein
MFRLAGKECGLRVNSDRLHERRSITSGDFLYAISVPGNLIRPEGNRGIGQKALQI